MFVEILWTLPLNQDQQRPEDVELAEVCEWKTEKCSCENEIIMCYMFMNNE